ncbi:putative reverse transcriptase domain-containing protein [Tanacetum coccineum]
MQKERVERDLYWTRVQAYELYQEMIHRGVVFEERPNEAIDVLVDDEDSPSLESRGSPQSVDAAIAAERARLVSAGNNASGSRPARGQVTVPVVRECTFARFMKCNPDKKVKFVVATLRGPALTWWNSKVAIMGLDVANQMGWTKMKKLMTVEFFHVEELQRMENELWNLKVKEYNMGEVTSSKPTNLNEASVYGIQVDGTKNNQKQGNARAITTALNEGKVYSRSLPMCER